MNIVVRDDVRRVRIDRHDVHRAPEAGERLTQPRLELRAGEDELCVRMVEDVFELRALRQQIERHYCVPAVHDADQQPPGLVTVVQHQGDLVACGKAACREKSFEPARSGGELPVRQHRAGFRRDEIGRVRLLRGAGVDVLPDR